METAFTQQMKDSSTKDLMEIITKHRDDYTPEAVSAAELELRSRNMEPGNIQKEYAQFMEKRTQSKYKWSGVELKNNKSRAESTIMLLKIVMGLWLVNYVALLFEVEVLQGLVSLAFIGLYIVFLRWLYRAYQNLHQCVDGLSYSPTWAVLCWFVPIINLYQPMNIVKELFDETEAFLRVRVKGYTYSVHSNVVDLWWWLLLLMAILSFIVMLLGAASIGGNYSTGTMIAGIIYLTLPVIFIFATLRAIKLVRTYGTLEEKMMGLEDEIEASFNLSP